MKELVELLIIVLFSWSRRLGKRRLKLLSGLLGLLGLLRMMSSFTRLVELGDEVEDDNDEYL